MKENKDKEQNSEMEDVQFEDQHTETKKGKGKGRKKKPTKEEKLLEEKEELQQKYNELNDRFLRLYSEFDNFRKRTAKERLELIKSASQDLIVDLLPVLDDFERGVKAFEDHHADPELIKGVELIYTKFYNILKQRGLKPMESMGKEFNTDWHEALTNIPAPSEDMKGKVVDVIQTGYLLNDKVIRYAKVVVGN
ncbi:MAG: nucleotide exchange factor GrpE [Bacteroidetes bacterium]|nr:MAG: nucleotide exchange factor GrpE [Bacteroidota bacterium]